MATYRCCKCGALNKVNKESIETEKKGVLVASQVVEEKTFPFHSPDQDEFARIYEDDPHDPGKWD